jgi:hypothetical protein
LYTVGLPPEPAVGGMLSTSPTSARPERSSTAAKPFTCTFFMTLQVKVRHVQHTHTKRCVCAEGVGERERGTTTTCTGLNKKGRSGGGGWGRARLLNARSQNTAAKPRKKKEEGREGGNAQEMTNLFVVPGTDLKEAPVDAVAALAAAAADRL